MKRFLVKKWGREKIWDPRAKLQKNFLGHNLQTLGKRGKGPFYESIILGEDPYQGASFIALGDFE